jgi:intracellular septation protein
MKFLFDFFPLVLFFIAFQLYDVYVATAVAIAATFAQIGWLKLRRRKVDTMLWVSLAIIVVFGGLTLALHDETFIKWKPTVLYWLFAAILAVSELGFGRNVMRAMLGAQVRMPDFAWRRLNWSWVGFFALMGAANLWVAFTFPLATWVKVKVFGGMGMLLLFVLLQAVYLSRFIEGPSTGSGQAEPGADDASPPR